ncbi:MAG: adenine phosphoribosyltransferase, partial [Rhodospirillales bacterium]|nr:adenine phosphoribosyltransferase [Rhodospirillales bacterium]
MSIKSRIRTIPDYPKPGIMFRDITTLLQDPVGFRLTIEGLVAPFGTLRIDKVAAIE